MNTTLIQQAKLLCEDVNYPISNMANISSLLYESLDDINWVGFYLFDEKKDLLYLGPFMGKVACTIIPMGKGVCGTAANNRKILRIDDVHTFKGHIACDSASNSEIVLPLIKNNQLLGVLDIDSPLTHRFTKEDENLLSQLVDEIVPYIIKKED